MENKSRHTENLNRIAKERGFDSYLSYIRYYRKRKGANRETEYQEELARRKGLNSANEYLRFLDSARSKRPDYRKLSSLITTRLSELRISQSELARRVQSYPKAISHYARGINYPKPAMLRKIFNALQLYHERVNLPANSQKPKHPKYRELSLSINYSLKRLKKTKEWLARKTGIRLEYISAYSKGLRYPSEKRLTKITRILLR